jgi:hypothetical protein
LKDELHHRAETLATCRGLKVPLGVSAVTGARLFRHPMEQIPHIRMIQVMRLLLVFSVHSVFQGVLRESLGSSLRHHKFPEDPFLVESMNREATSRCAAHLLEHAKHDDAGCT